MAEAKDQKLKSATLDGLLKIFTIQKLRDLRKHCHDEIVSHHDLANFIMWCKSSKDAPFLHTSLHREFVPEHLHLKDTDLSALAENGVGRFKPAAQKTANKVFAMLDERRILSGHLFQTIGQWHFIYFDNHDRTSHRNHWSEGPHIHLINYLWPNRTADSVWNEFRDGNPTMKGAFHIRYKREA
jgi:hypothetical protein